MTKEEKLLIVLEESMKHVLENQALMLAEVKKTNGRVTSLERWKYYMIGGGAVVVLIVGWLVQSR